MSLAADVPDDAACLTQHRLPVRCRPTVFQKTEVPPVRTGALFLEGLLRERFLEAEPSPPGVAHVPDDLSGDRLARVVEIVALGLAFDRRANGLFDKCVVVRGAQRRAEVGHVLLSEAHVEFARAGEPHPVAAFAEIVRERRDEADLLARLLDPDVAGRAARAFSEIDEAEAGGQAGAEILERPVLVE